MLKIRSFSDLIDISRIQEYDTNGLPEIIIQLNDSSEAVNLLTRVDELENKILSMEVEKQKEKYLLMNNPALQDAYEKYRIMLQLTKDENVSS
jgi:hypothetical protein